MNPITITIGSWESATSVTVKIDERYFLWGSTVVNRIQAGEVKWNSSLTCSDDMRAIVTQFEGDTPRKGYLLAGKDYTEYEAELDQEDAIRLLRRLRPSRSRVLFKGATSTAEFHLQPDRVINLEISSLTAFWAISEVSDSEAESIIQTLYGGEDFGELIPGTKREWDAWGDGT